MISTRIKIRPELENALTLAHEIKTAATGQPVILPVHELKRLARNAAELMTLSARLQSGGVQLGAVDPAADRDRRPAPHGCHALRPCATREGHPDAHIGFLKRIRFQIISSPRGRVSGTGSGPGSGAFRR
ncbi:recombinase family protein [Rhodococcus jostii]|uniref:recombinase family protein n=1 Tax=Rhodococcus jostii TaxID=132919 RepID=UPI003630F6E9